MRWTIENTIKYESRQNYFRPLSTGERHASTTIMIKNLKTTHYNIIRMIIVATRYEDNVSSSKKNTEQRSFSTGSESMMQP